MIRIEEIPTPAVLIDKAAMERNIRNMQAVCDANGVQLWPHCKTHKLVPVLRRQLEAGATGATCAKLSEIEALLPSGVRRAFLAHSMPTDLIGPRLKQVASQLDELILGVTSEAYFEVLDAALEREGLRFPVLMAVDTGLDREGVRSIEAGKKLHARIAASPRMEFRGLYTHEGHTAMGTLESLDSGIADVMAQMENYGAAIGGEVLLWPGCSFTAARIATMGKAYAVRPGAYVFGDLYLSRIIPVMKEKDVALSVLTTVLDRPTPDLALIDAGTKTFSSDKTPQGAYAGVVDNKELYVTRLSEEHGFISKPGLDLKIGTRLRCIPAHVCPVMNLASQVYLMDGEKVLEIWPVDARGCNY